VGGGGRRGQPWGAPRWPRKPWRRWPWWGGARRGHGRALAPSLDPVLAATEVGVGGRQRTRASGDGDWRRRPTEPVLAAADPVLAAVDPVQAEDGGSRAGGGESGAGGRRIRC
jgi:hypothetical protein